MEYSWDIYIYTYVICICNGIEYWWHRKMDLPYPRFDVSQRENSSDYFWPDRGTSLGNGGKTNFHGKFSGNWPILPNIVINDGRKVIDIVIIMKKNGGFLANDLYLLAFLKSLSEKNWRVTVAIFWRSIVLPNLVFLEASEALLSPWRHGFMTCSRITRGRILSAYQSASLPSGKLT